MTQISWVISVTEYHNSKNSNVAGATAFYQTKIPRDVSGVLAN